MSPQHVPTTRFFSVGCVANLLRIQCHSSQKTLRNIKMNAFTVASPCINICKIDDGTQRCIGCDRSIDEITRWSRMDDDAKQAGIDGIVLRKRANAADAQHVSNQPPSNQSEQNQQTPITPGKPSRSDNTAPGVPGKRSSGCE